MQRDFVCVFLQNIHKPIWIPARTVWYHPINQEDGPSLADRSRTEEVKETPPMSTKHDLLKGSWPHGCCPSHAPTPILSPLFLWLSLLISILTPLPPRPSLILLIPSREFLVRETCYYRNWRLPSKRVQEPLRIPIHPDALGLDHPFPCFPSSNRGKSYLQDLDI